jgi:hypothetical protein
VASASWVVLDTGNVFHDALARGPCGVKCVRVVVIATSLPKFSFVSRLRAARAARPLICIVSTFVVTAVFFANEDNPTS